jgi:hypothetical protein
VQPSDCFTSATRSPHRGCPPRITCAGAAENDRTFEGRCVSGEKLCDEGPHPLLDLVADWLARISSLACRVVELPLLLAVAWVEGQVSPQPMVMTTSEAEPRSRSTVLTAPGRGRCLPYSAAERRAATTRVPTGLEAAETGWSAKLRAISATPVTRVFSNDADRRREVRGRRESWVCHTAANRTRASAVGEASGWVQRWQHIRLMRIRDYQVAQAGQSPSLAA